MKCIVTMVFVGMGAIVFVGRSSAATVSNQAVVQRSFLQRGFHVGVAGGSSTNALEKIVPLDLWAIHDLLMVGHRGPLVRTDAAASLRMVHTAADSLAGMLHDIHPVPECRLAVAQADTLAAKAGASWTCLGLTPSSFNGAFVSDSQSNYDVDSTRPKFYEKLGACKDSQWPRACSYWTSMHAMGVRADMLGKGKEFFQALVHIFAGGALYCMGCTLHMRLLCEDLLPSAARTEDVMGY
jgi:hypothetical protein